MIQGGSFTLLDTLAVTISAVLLRQLICWFFSKYLTDEFLKASISAVLGNAGLMRKKFSSYQNASLVSAVSNKKEKSQQITTWWKFQGSGLIVEVHGPRVGYQTWISPCPHSRITPSHPEPHFIIQVKPANDNPGTVTQWSKRYSKDSCNIKKKNQNK